jgi:hypothetical protein
LALLGISGSDVSNAAMTSVFWDGTQSPVRYASLYSNKPDLFPAAQAEWRSTTVAAYLAIYPNVKAVADIKGNRVFINPAHWGADGKGDMTTVMHELIHNASGLTDADFERRLEAAGFDKNLSTELRGKCIT